MTCRVKKLLHKMCINRCAEGHRRKMLFRCFCVIEHRARKKDKVNRQRILAKNVGAEYTYCLSKFDVFEHILLHYGLYFCTCRIQERNVDNVIMPLGLKFTCSAMHSF